MAGLRKKCHPEIVVPFMGNVLDQWSHVLVRSMLGPEIEEQVQEAQ